MEAGKCAGVRMLKMDHENPSGAFVSDEEDVQTVPKNVHNAVARTVAAESMPSDQLSQEERERLTTTQELIETEDGTETPAPKRKRRSRKVS